MLYLNIHQPWVRHFFQFTFSKLYIFQIAYISYISVILMQQLFNALKPRLHLKER